MPLTSQLKPSRFFDLTQDSFCSRNKNDFARSKTADFRSGIFRFRSRIRVGLTIQSFSTRWAFFFFSEKNPVYRDRTPVPTCQKVTRLPLSYRATDYPVILYAVANPVRGLYWTRKYLSEEHLYKSSNNVGIKHKNQGKNDKNIGGESGNFVALVGQENSEKNTKRFHWLGSLRELPAGNTTPRACLLRHTGSNNITSKQPDNNHYLLYIPWDKAVTSSNGARTLLRLNDQVRRQEDMTASQEKLGGGKVMQNVSISRLYFEQ